MPDQTSKEGCFNNGYGTAGRTDAPEAAVWSHDDSPRFRVISRTPTPPPPPHSRLPPRNGQPLPPGPVVGECPFQDWSDVGERHVTALKR